MAAELEVVGSEWVLSQLFLSGYGAMACVGGRGRRKMFEGRQFDQSVILLCVRWYLAYNLSLRNLEEMMAERGVSVDHATVHRWVVRYSSELLERFNRRKRAVTGKWHVDETTSRSVDGGCTCTGPSAATATRLSLVQRAAQSGCGQALSAQGTQAARPT
jgi:hypothetical protein